MMIEISESKVEKMSDYAERCFVMVVSLCSAWKRFPAVKKWASAGMKIADMTMTAILTKRIWANAAAMAVVAVQVVVAVAWVKDVVLEAPDVIPVIVKCNHEESHYVAPL